MVCDPPEAAQLVEQILAEITAVWAGLGGSGEGSEPAVGATGMLVLRLHCPSGAAAHLVLSHLLRWLGVALLAVALRRLLPSRSFAP